MRAKGTNGVRRLGSPDRELWRRSQEAEATPDEAERFLDLAAFADHRLDDDNTARLAALIARDADVTEDVEAARGLARAVPTAVDERVIARAAALVGESPPGAVEPEALVSSALVIAFPPRSPAARPWHGAATWSGLAAAIAIASWLGFDLGSVLSTFPAGSRPSDEASASEFFDPAPLLLRDFTENSQI
jgi:hypothetical protein